MLAPRSRERLTGDPVTAARQLVGCLLVSDGDGDGDEVVAEVVEVEAYLGRDDPASHAFRGPTRRAAMMFGPPGRLYVYLSYGLHHCANVVLGESGSAGAALLRAAAVRRGHAVVHRRRLEAPRRGAAAGWRAREMSGTPEGSPAAPARGDGRLLAEAALLRGPGNLCRGLDIRLADNGTDLCDATSRLRLVEPDRPAPPVVVAPRVGITAAVEAPLRFAWRGHPAVSAPLPWPRVMPRGERGGAGPSAGPRERRR